MAAHSDSNAGWLSNHYVKVYLALLVLLVVSILGPEVAPRLGEGEIPGLGIRVSTFAMLVTAFGIAVVKAWLVVKNFMHLSIERPIAKWFLAASVLLLALFWGGIAPDVQSHSGANWENLAAQAAVERGIESSGAHGDGYGGGTDADHAEEAPPPSLVPTSKSTGHLLPGGYNFTHGAFWTVVALVAIGTNAVAIMLSVGAGLLVFETIKALRRRREA